MNPKDTPLEQWPSGWLTMETASLLDVPGFIVMHDWEKDRAGYPVTDDDMREFIRERREIAADYHEERPASEKAEHEQRHRDEEPA